MTNAFSSLWIWDRVGDRLPWYLAVAEDRMPAKYLISRRIPCNLDLRRATEDELWVEHARATERFLEAWGALRRGELRLSELPRAKPSLLDLSSELAGRMLGHCTFCRWNCRVDRLAGRRSGACQLDSLSRVSAYFRHTGEELFIRGTHGSGTVFFTSCNLRCQFCLHPGSFVLTESGPVRISELYLHSPGDVERQGGHVRFPVGLRVYSGHGRLVRVSGIFKHEHAGDLVQIEALYAPPISVTPGHEMIVSDARSGDVVKLRAGALRSSHRLVVPRPQGKWDSPHFLDVPAILRPWINRVDIATGAQARLPALIRAVALSQSGVTSREIGTEVGYHPSYVRKFLSRIQREGYPQFRRKNTLVIEDGKVRMATEKRPGIPARILVNRQLAEFLGYYCAEGYVTQAANRPSSLRIGLTFGKHEKDLFDRAAELFMELFGLDSQLVERRTALAVEAGKSSLGVLLRELCGSGALSKKVPEFLFHSPPSVVESFLAAFAEGDGCVTRGHLSLNTVSQSLAMGLYALFLQRGHLPSYNVWEPTAETVIEGRRVKQSTLYYIKVNVRRLLENSWSVARHVRYKFDDGQITVPIFRVRRVHYRGPVFNLEVADSAHSYVANFLAVGNCQNGDISHDKENGIPVSPREVAAMAWQLRKEGCHNINWVGGEPTVHLHTIVEAIRLLGSPPTPEDLTYVQSVNPGAAWPFRRPDAVGMYEGEFNVPMLWNSNFFMSPEAMRILRPLVDVWLPDFKFGNDKCSVFLSRTPWYWETVTRNHQTVYDWGEDMAIRHLVMPGHVECCTKPVLAWIAAHTPQALVNVMDQYRPEYACDRFSPAYDDRYRGLARRPNAEEILEAYRYAEDLGLRFEELSYEKNVTGLRA